MTVEFFAKRIYAASKRIFIDFVGRKSGQIFQFSFYFIKIGIFIKVFTYFVEIVC